MENWTVYNNVTELYESHCDSVSDEEILTHSHSDNFSNEVVLLETHEKSQIPTHSDQPPSLQ